jgi:hypothetical protein
MRRADCTLCNVACTGDAVAHRQRRGGQIGGGHAVTMIGLGTFEEWQSSNHCLSMVELNRP